MTNDRATRFSQLLKTMFELDKSDLDFGIYRLINLRKARIESFLTERLPQMVTETLAPFAQNDARELREELARIEQTIAATGMTIDMLPETAPAVQDYRRVKAALAEGADADTLENEVYAALFSFFSRYYEDGDFVSKRRYKDGVYAIPYEGEEVKLYWANHDQYYIKSGENFSDYVFHLDDITVRFLLTDATVEKNNNKENDAKRTFFLAKETPVTFDADSLTLTVRFIYDICKDKQPKCNDQTIDAVTAFVASNGVTALYPLVTDGGKDVPSPLRTHLNTYTAKNTFDFFIHKDLHGFLSRELDFFIKTEVMDLDNIDTDSAAAVESYLGKVKAIKRVGRVIIDFLSQLEEFQKALWLKKKFVVSIDWCVSLDRVDESFWDEIAANRAQIDEWISLYAIDEADGFSFPPSRRFLKANQNLIVDTAHFSEEFKLALTASFDNLDDQLTGTMINGDNFHALGLLSPTYDHRIKYVYIDPPYNAKSSEIFYKNTFKHASWMSMIHNRIERSLPLLTDDSVYTIAIDDAENHRLAMLADDLLGHYSGKTDVSVIINPSGQQGKNFSATGEYLHFYYHDTPHMLEKESRTEETADHRDFMNGSKGESGNYLRASGKTCFYPIYVKDGEVIDFGDVCPDDFHPTANVVEADGVTAIYPIDADGVERKWLFGRDTVEDIIDELNVERSSTTGLLKITRTKTEINYKTVWTDKKYSAKQHGTVLLSKLFGKKNKVFTFPKSLYAVMECVRIAASADKSATVLDFFAGSATTAHAVMRLNLQDGGHRRFVLAEMGEYFRKTTKTRVKKAAYAVNESSWNNGKPTNRRDGCSQLIEYLSIESYEDALSNIVLSDDGECLEALLGDDYLVRYMMNTESRDSLLNLNAFTDPFAYTMRITEKNERHERRIDVIETFRFLIGLRIARQSPLERFDTIAAQHPPYDGAVTLIPAANGRFTFRRMEGTLPDGRRALVIWRTVDNDLAAANAALEAYFLSLANRDFDVIFVNGDNTLSALLDEHATAAVELTELVFKRRMFGEG